MIDARTTRDRDDAITVVATESGWTATVHVACVADRVSIGSDADADAARRGASAYLSDRVIAMLGNSVEDAATLSETADRSAISVQMQFDTDAELLDAAITRTILPAGSCAALTHNEVSAALETATSAHHDQLLTASRLTGQLMARRRSAGAFVVYDAHRGLVSTEDGRLISVPAGQNATAYVLVQELMIAANAAIAQWAINRDLPILFRNHRQSAVAPDTRHRLDDVAAALSTATTAAELDAVTTRINQAVGKATYDPVVHGHYGLQLAAYTHATSPLRRYADLITQRILCAALDGTAAPYTSAQLGEIAAALTELTQERAARVHERHKTKARRDTANAIAAANFSTMGEREFLRVIKLATQTAPNAAVVDELNVRAGDGRLHAGHLAQVLDTTFDGWLPVRAALFEQMRLEQPHLAAGVLSGWQHLTTGEATPPLWDTKVDGPPHTPRFAIRAHLGDTVTRWHVSTSKKTAEQHALWDLLDIAGGHRTPADLATPPPLSTPATPPPVGGLPAAAPSVAVAPMTTSLSVTVSDLVEALGTPMQVAKKRAAARSNPIGWLTSFAAANGLTGPEVDTDASGPAHQPQFTVTMTVGPLSAAAEAPTVKAAKSSAAHAVLDALFAHVDGTPR